MLTVHFYNHAYLVAFCEQLADDLTSFLFRTDGGELTLEIKRDEITEHATELLDDYISSGDAMPA